ncbi:response regulator [Flexivirga oryzae]|uniref:DNA-binding NarL/FixJ family response regulator n=1 Tax=Flexivirga oryzae TaxID=1794944 RepID=A0A839N6M0_9MICO|nr:response regulator transcription factor [Flexivirga oryzae]MBB2891723.1 DNA-binding NarL/FixJ family response regulator [Flexivirga oryzae]
MSPDTKPIRVVVVDDQTVIRESVAAMLDLYDDLEVVGTAADGAQAVSTAIAQRAEVVLMDLNMPVMDGADATSALSERAPEVNVLILTTYGDDASIMRALDAGARGYLTKDAGRAEIAAAIRTVAGGQAVLDPKVQEQLVRAAMQRSAAPAPAAPAAAPAGLTPRESEVLTLIASGLTNREIARRLVVSEGTVKTHINNLFAKAGVRDRAAAVTFAFQHGLGPTDGS